jgi:hypothetical protein
MIEAGLGIGGLEGENIMKMRFGKHGEEDNSRLFRTTTGPR